MVASSDGKPFDAAGMPDASADPTRPLYLRVGTWNPDSPASFNYAAGTREDGVSVYALDADGDVVLPLDGEWAEDDLRDRLRGTGHAFFLVQGDRLPRNGHDGEPLLSDPKVVGLWEPPPASPWAAIFRSGGPRW